MKAQPIDYEILEDGRCSYCGGCAEWVPINDWDGYSTCVACDSYNEDVEMGLIEENPTCTVLFGHGNDNLNVYF